MMLVNQYLGAVGVPPPIIPGGQELIFPEILACLEPGESIYVPFDRSGFLTRKLQEARFEVKSPREVIIPRYPHVLPRADSIYFGTPTIVNGRPLFDIDSYEWNKTSERGWVRRICRMAEELKYKKIISGLGSGDISPEERIEDMGGGRIVAYKDFGTFQDWVIMRKI
jgi:hypothetical protein